MQGENRARLVDEEPLGALGEIVSVDGAQIEIAVEDMVAGAPEQSPVGEIGSILNMTFGDYRLYALVSSARVVEEPAPPRLLLQATLFGERKLEAGAEFERGISRFPLVHTPVYPTPPGELESLYHGDGETGSFHLGEYRNTNAMACRVDINALLTQPAVVLGSTGMGKSATISTVVHGLLEYDEHTPGVDSWKPRIVILDPHGEYNAAFPNACYLSSSNPDFSLPYWLLDLQETLNLFVDKSSDTAVAEADIIRKALIRVRYEQASYYGYDPQTVTADSPIPYLLGEAGVFNEFGRMGGNVLYETGLIGKINAERPVDPDRDRHRVFNKLIQKIELLKIDSRVAFFMREPEDHSNILPDILQALISETAQPVIVDLAGMPGETAGILSAALARILFSLRVWQTADERERSPILLICEEAHRYVPASSTSLHGSAQAAIGRIASEGRKYGLGLMLVSQRPSELAPGVLSQCTNWIVLRIANESDLSHVRSQLPDTFSALADALPGLQRREALFVGSAARWPAIIRIRELQREELPASRSMDFVAGWHNEHISREALVKVGNRWVQQGLPSLRRGGEQDRE